MDMESVWKRIAAWYSVNVPNEEFGLAPGASDEQIATFESATGVELPDDVKASYLMHNGGAAGQFEPASLVHYGPFLSLDGMLSQWKFHREMEEDGEYEERELEILDEPIDPIWMPMTRLPITDNSGDHLLIDTLSEAGTNGQIISYSHEIGPDSVVAESWFDFLCELADDLETGEYEYNEEEETVCPLGMYD